MKKSISFAGVVGLFLLIFCCTLARAQDVRYNFVPGTDFAKYKTYKWVVIEQGGQPDQIMDAQIKQAVDSQLAARGLTKVDNDKADLYVAYQIAVDKEKQWNAYNLGGPGNWRWGGMGTATSSTINVGTLVLDIYDTAAKQLVWKGTATKTIEPSKDPQKNQEKLQKAIAKLMKNYPPPAKK